MPSITEKFRDFRASKVVLFWSCAGCIVATMVVGFTWGGWTTAGAAAERAEEASEQAVALLASDICFDRFLAAPDVRVNLTALHEESRYRRDRMVSDGGWVTFAEGGEAVPGAAKLCADRLAEVDIATLPELPVAEATMVPATEVTAVQ